MTARRSSAPAQSPTTGAAATDHRLLRRIREGLIGDDRLVPGPFGPRRITYLDHTASGRAVDFIEDYIRERVLPYYANTHSESSSTGRRTTQLREQARQIIADSVGAGDNCAVIFCGSGTTAAVDKLIGILGLRIPAELDRRYGLGELIPFDERPVVFLGPYEHHSNDLPWRESIADVVTIDQDDRGHVDLAHFERELVRYRQRPLKIGSFSAASNVTGILTDTAAIATLLHQHGALSFWDFAAAAPHRDIDMAGASPLAYLDAVFFSPHKFIGGPGTPGVLVVRKDLLHNPVPVVPGGGTVAYVNATTQRYLTEPSHREEGGTPAIVESIRAGLAVRLRQAVGSDLIHAQESSYLRRAIEAWRTEPAIEMLGDLRADRLSIMSFVLRAPSGRYLHHNFVVALLNDLFGIQARGGCSCAAPYGHRLLAIDDERSLELEREIVRGCNGIKPGWTRVNFPYFLSEAVFTFVIEAVLLIARDGWRLLPDYRFDPATGMWWHRQSPAELGESLTDLIFDAAGISRPGEPAQRAAESDLLGYLDAARAVFAAHREQPAPADAVTGGVPSAEFDHLRSFELPACCLAPVGAQPELR